MFTTLNQGSSARARSWVLGNLLGLCMAFVAGSSWAFSLDDVASKAEKLAASPYVQPQSNLPSVFRQMTFADYQQLRFREDKGYWRDAETPFELRFYHQGMHFDVPVKINEVTATRVREIRYDPELFEFGNVDIDPAALKDLASPVSKCSIR